MADKQTTVNRDRDHQLADAYMGLEDVICDLRGAAALLDIVADDMVFNAENETELEIKKAVGLSDGYHLRLWSEQKSVALAYLLNQILASCNQLHRKYYAGTNAPEVGHG
jgi:hypothetical protein